MAESMPRRRESSVLVSLKELRNIETDRLEREEERRLRREREARAAREAQERALREAEERRRREQEQREREEQERQARIQREERLRLAEAERRARVEAELALERQRLELQMGRRPRAEGRSAATPHAGAERQASPRAPWLATAGTTVVLGCVIALMSQKLHQETARAASLLDRIAKVKGDAARIKRHAEARIASLGSQVAELQGRLYKVITAPKPEPAPRRPRHPKRPRRPKIKEPDPTISTKCIGSTDVLCGILEEKEKKKRR